ncbi:17-beta-hydroxysteroid dehydrogenase type 6 isoform X2 [Anabrus simplex]|uniref:17-beta-hydroxysteroid dehydrogenase type 6 isoform X2 n=1 Tax=Anabrus simplex TaxID=316456 RepID=UPI0035A2AD77
MRIELPACPRHTAECLGVPVLALIPHRALRRFETGIMPSLTMIRRIGIFFTCLVVSYTLVRLLLDKDISALILYCALGLTLGRIMYAVILKLIPTELLPELHKKAIFITGCDTGFGHLLALKADSLGLLVYAGCLFPEGDGAKALKEKCSDRTHIISLDVTNDKLVEAAAHYVKSTLGDKGFISISGITTYCASKHASVAFTEGLRQELKKFSISVHSIEPAFYMTRLMDILYPTNIWDECPKHIKEVYGEDYYEIFQSRILYLVRMLRVTKHELNSVVDGMVEASVGVRPPDSISPALIDWVIKILLIYVPTVVMNFVKNLCQPKLSTLGNWIVNKLQAMSKEKEEKIR